MTKLTFQQGLVKAQRYCVYQDRCHQEVRNKLIEWGIYYDDLELIISELIQENFLNEERFACSFARGKFRIKKWGKIKITIELKKRFISEYCIRKGLLEIDQEEYYKTLQQVIDKKFYASKEKKPLLKKQKVAKYAQSRGFEGDMIWEILNEI